MIDRYTRKEIKNIWEDHNRYSLWLEIELAAAEAMEKLKIIPKGVVKKVKSKAKIDPKRILQIEEKVKHDIIAFLTSITEKAGKEARYLHKGMTSSDVLDTCFNLQLKKSGEILIGLKYFFSFVKNKGLYIIEDFKFPNYYQYNNNINHIFVDEFLRNLVNKKLSSSNIFTQEEQLILIESIEKIENFKGNLKESDISFISKN